MIAYIHPVILSGGHGTRLWPLSRVHSPKPFLPLVGDTTLFQLALSRVSQDEIYAPPMVVSGAGHGVFVDQQAGHVNGLVRIEEPEGRNTAPAIGLAALLADKDAILLVCPSDHFISKDQAFQSAVRDAAKLAAQGYVVAFGIEMTAPETGYGYIKRGDALTIGYKVAQFVEKPDLETAMRFLADGQHCWNGGIFCVRAGTYIDELTMQRPEMAALLRKAVALGETRDGVFYPHEDSFLAIAGESIDYAVMEGAKNAAMIPVSMGWSDIGNWFALRDIRHSIEAGEGGNVASGPVELVDCENVMVHSDGPRVSAIGMKDTAIVVNGNEVLVTSLTGAQSVGKLAGARAQ